MNDKKAVVFDTNFIIQNKDLVAITEELGGKYVPCVSQITIDERIAQQCRDQKRKFEHVEAIKEECKWIANIEFTTTYEEYAKNLCTGVQSNYRNLFCSNILTLKYDSELITTVIERANYKTPPFATDENASDKGFKDTLIWLSILSYFKENGPKEVFFLTDDRGFLKNKDVLTAEFIEVTGKNIEICPNSHYDELINKNITPTEERNLTMIEKKSVEYLRDKINIIIDNLCNVEAFDHVWGISITERTFTINKRVTDDYMDAVFGNMETVLINHIFETDVTASEVFDLDGRINDTVYRIPMQNIEDAIELFNYIKADYPNFLKQFFSATAVIVNRNYVEADSFCDDIPF